MTLTQTPFDFDTRLEPMRAPAQRHSATSIAAAFDIEPKAGTLRGAVLAHLRGCGTEGATDEQQQLALNMNPSTQRPRRIELVKSAHVYDSGRTRKTASGHPATVWLAHPRREGV